MYEATLAELQQLIRDEMRARQYAIEHYEELAARPHVHVLYGPHDSSLGASIPCNRTAPKRVRKLVLQTRRKDYNIYHLDENYRVLRTIQVLDGKIDRLCHHFEMDGVVYVYPHSDIYPYEDMEYLRFADGKPVAFGQIYSYFVFIQYYEYLDPERMMVSTYRYTPGVQRTVHGCIPNPDAPTGAPDSVVQRHFYEEVAENTDFSRWFR